jgi:hypothetical protein
MALLIIGKFPRPASEIMQRAPNIVKRWYRAEELFAVTVETELVLSLRIKESRRVHGNHFTRHSAAYHQVDEVPRGFPGC